jgi:hypothetical protein
MTLSGCVQSEADYRRSQGSARGGAAGTGIGASNEFILVNAQMGTSGAAASAGSGAAGTQASGAGGTATGTTGTGTTTTRSGTAYELSGSAEGQLAQYVGRRVEISGMLKSGQSTGTTGSTAGGPTANLPLSSDLKLPEFEVTSVRPGTGTCPSQPQQ